MTVPNLGSQRHQKPNVRLQVGFSFASYLSKNSDLLHSFRSCMVIIHISNISHKLFLWKVTGQHIFRLWESLLAFSVLKLC